jgi:hypothetical protein
VREHDNGVPGRDLVARVRDVRGMCEPSAPLFEHPAYTQRMPNVTIAVAAHPLAPGRHLVVAWLAAVDAEGSPYTRGLAEIWVGHTREGLARIATRALDELERPTGVEFVLRRHDPTEPPPEPETAAALAKAWERHDVTFTAVRAPATHEALEAAEAFAVSRAAGVVAGPAEAAKPEPPPSRAPKPFDR